MCLKTLGVAGFKTLPKKSLVMDFTFYAVLVTIAAIVYSFATREIQFKYGNQTQMTEFQKRSKELTDQMNEANKQKDQKKMEEIMKKQAQLMPEMSKLMLGQFKLMIPILLIFFAFTWLVGHFDPTATDDYILQLTDDGKNCDKIADDRIFSVCITPKNENYGVWQLDVKAINGGNIAGENSTYFYYVKEDMTFSKGPKGEPVELTLSSNKIGKGETVTLTAYSKNAQTVQVTVNNGTHFYVDLPFTIPVVNVSRINEAYWWFIFVALISGLAISFIMGKIRNKKQEVKK